MGLKNLIMLAALLGLALPAFAEQVSGTVQWYKRVELGTPVSGVVEQVAAQAGMHVKAGALLVQLDQRPFQAKLTRASADLKQLKLAYEEAQRELGREKELYDRGMLSEHEMQMAKIAFGDAEARYKVAEQTRTLSELNLGYASVRAPFAGVVLAVHTAKGATVVSQLNASPLVVLASTEHYLAQVLLPIERLKGLKKGGKAQVKLNGHSYAAKVYSVGLERAAGQGPARYPVQVMFDAAGQTLRSGQGVSVELP